MILNPSCSEIIVNIGIRNEEEAIEVIKDLIKSTGEKFVIEFSGWGDTYILQEKIDNGITTLVIGKVPTTTAYSDMPKAVYLRFDLEVPTDLIRTENGYLVLDRGINDCVFEKIQTFVEDATVRKSEEKNFTNVKIDFSNLNTLYLSIGHMGLFFYRKGSNFVNNENLNTKHAVELSNNDLKWNAFPAYKKILTDLSKIYKIRIHTEGGEIGHLDEWCKYNFLDFLLQRDRFTGEKTPSVGTIYVYSEDQEEFKEVLKQLENFNFSVFGGGTKINPQDMTDFRVSDPLKFIGPFRGPGKLEEGVKINGQGVSLFGLDIMPSNIDLSKYTDWREKEKFSKYLKIGFSPLPETQTPVLYIYQEDRYAPKEDYTKVIQLFERTSKKVIKVVS
jgi:hypothetical protein